LSRAYRVLVTDVDGTLLGPSGEIDPRDAAAVRELLARDVAVTICTGRMFSGTRHLALQLGLDAPIACVDGSHIVHAPSGRELSAAPLVSDAARALLDVLVEFGPAAFAYSNDQVFHTPNGAEYTDYVRTWSERLNEVADLHEDVDWHAEDSRVTAVVALGTEKQIRRSAEALSERARNLVQSATFPAFRASRRGAGTTWGMLVRAHGVDKGTAIEWLSRHYDCSVDEIVTLGDWLNDVPMLRRAGLSFAMAQAPDEVKSAAKEVLEADSWSGGAIAEAAARAGLL
jgi:Cof subfamily protein (haloacid dehalogenase superfamily)